MCFGGGSRATITKPDYNAYDKQFELQKEAIQNSMMPTCALSSRNCKRRWAIRLTFSAS